MNSTLDIINNRMSLRKYDEKNISDEHKEALIKAILRAPTAGNLMLYSIIDVENKENKQKLSVLCDNQPFIAKAPMVLIFLADTERIYDYFKYSGVEEKLKQEDKTFKKQGKGGLMLGISDALIAAQNGVIAAESMGIGSCYIGDIMENYEEIKELFKLPKGVFPIGMLTFGYYPLDYPRRITTRYNSKYIVHKDTYKKLMPEDFEEMYKEKEEWLIKSRIESADNFGQLLYNKKFGSDFSKEMDRSVNLMLKNWQ